jgi:hypothetical protein
MQSKYHRHTSQASVLVLYFVGLVAVSPAMSAVETVALSGDAAPGGPAGAVFLEFGLSVINNNGSVAFAAGMEPGVGGVTLDDALGIWTNASGALAGVTVGDPPAPGVPGAVFESLFSVPQLSDTGAVYAEFQLETGPGGITADNDYGGWLFSGGGQPVYREGNSLPGLASDAELFFGRAELNAFGNVALFGRFRDGIGGITPENNRGLWVSTGGALNLVVQSGDAADGAPAGAVLEGFGLNAFNDHGVVSSMGQLREGVGGVTADDSEVIYSNRSGAYTLEYREGDPATGGAVFDSFQSIESTNNNRLAPAHLSKVSAVCRSSMIEVSGLKPTPA